MSQSHDDDRDDAFHDECGVVGVFGHPKAAVLTALGLHALQHRGQESAGIVSFDGREFNSERHLGLVGDHFSEDAQSLDRLPGEAAVGHVRYSTSGDTILRNVQPLYADLPEGGIAIAHNGNLTNANRLRRRLVSAGAIFQSTSDTETILHLIATSGPGRMNDRLAQAMQQVEGAYSLVCLTNKKLIGMRDPHGVRPLVLGRIDDAFVLASETCALDIMGADFERDIEPGEMVVFEKNRPMRSLHPMPKAPERFCVFEYIYFSRPDSIIRERGVYDVRKRIGAELATEAPADAQVVCPVPDSGVPAAIGFAEAASLPFDYGIIRNHYVGRTFIQPTDHSRNHGVRMKHNANSSVLNGKSVVLVDDSIIRGTTSIKIVKMVRDAGAREIHMRIASPPNIDSCHYGVDTPHREKLLASQMTLEDMRQYIGVDSLAYLSMDGLYRALGYEKRDTENPQFCDACFSGDYPIPLTDQKDGEVPPQLTFLH